MKNITSNIFAFIVVILFLFSNKLSAQCEFTISPSTTLNACLQAEEDVVWKNISGNLVATGNNLSRSAGSGWNEGSESTASVKNYGFASTIVNETNTNRMFGLSNTNTNDHFNTIDYAFYFISNGTVGIYESGTFMGNAGPYFSGDTAKIAVRDGNVYYYINDNMIYTSSASPTLPLVVDVSLFSNGSTINNVVISNGTDGTFTSNATSLGTGPTYQWKLNGSNVGTSSSTYTNPAITNNDTLTCDLTPGAGGCAVGTFTSNTISIRQTNLADNSSLSISSDATNNKCDRATTQATFGTVGSNMASSNNDLIKDGADGWDGGAVSSQSIQDNGEAYTVINETNTLRMFGLTNSGAIDANYTAIDYAIYFLATGTINIFESGVSRGAFGSYSSGDTARIVADDGNIHYYLNNTLLYSSAVSPVFPLYADVSIFTNGATLEDIHLVNGTAGSFNANVIGAGTSPTYQWKLNGANVGSNSASYSNPSLSPNDEVTCEVTPDITGCIGMTLISNAISFHTEDPSPDRSVSISTTATDAKCSRTTTEATFSDLANKITANGNSLVKDGDNAWDGGAVSMQNINDNGEVYTIVNETNTGRMFGLTNSGAADSNYTTIDYAIYLVSNRTIGIFESGVSQGSFGSYSSGDTARVVSEDGNINYYLNSTLLYSSMVTPTFPLYVDLSIFSDGGTLENINLISGSDGNFSADVINAGVSPNYQWKLNGANVGSNSPTYSNSSLSLHDTLTCEVTPDFTGCTLDVITSNTIIMTVAQLLTQWNGGTTNWFSASNWNNGVPTENAEAFISGAAPTMPTISGSNASCQDLTIDNSATLIIAGSEILSISGDFTNNGTFTGNTSTIEMLEKCDESASSINPGAGQGIYNLTINNSNGVNLTGGSIVLTGALTLTNGLFHTNNALTLVSDINGTARIAEITSGSITGNITVQRYIASGATDWRFLTSAVSGTTLADFNDDFTTSGFTGSDYPTWPTAGDPWESIFFYDETNTGTVDDGYVAPTNITNSLGVGQGIWAWCGDASAGTAAFTIDVTGPANTGDISLPVTYTSTGSADDDGWCMVGNPYASTIDWDDVSITKSAINSAIYIWNPNVGNFACYIPGVHGTNGGSKNIASSQAFWVQTNASSPILTVTEASKTTDGGTFLKQSSPSSLIIEVVNNSGKDETVINFNSNATPNFDGNFDGLKMATLADSVPSISTIGSDTSELAINQLPEQEINIPLKVTTGTSGLHQISFSGISKFSNAACIIIEDIFTGKSYDLNDTESITAFIHDTTASARFLIKIGASSTIKIDNISCYGSEDGEILFEKNSPNAFDIMWKDNTGKILANNPGVISTDNISNLSAGTYIIETTDNNCGIQIDTVVINEPLKISALFSTSADTIYLSNGANIDFTNNSTNAKYYNWDFDDLNSSLLASPSHQYTQAGNYFVTLNAFQNANCFNTISKEIVVFNTITGINNSEDNLREKIWINNNNLIIDAQNIDRIKIQNIAGQLIHSSDSKKERQIFNLDNLSSQMLLVSIISADKTTSTKKVSFVKK